MPILSISNNCSFCLLTPLYLLYQTVYSVSNSVKIAEHLKETGVKFLFLLASDTAPQWRSWKSLLNTLDTKLRIKADLGCYQHRSSCFGLYSNTQGRGFFNISQVTIKGHCQWSNQIRSRSDQKTTFWIGSKARRHFCSCFSIPVKQWPVF